MKVCLLKFMRLATEIEWESVSNWWSTLTTHQAEQRWNKTFFGNHTFKSQVSGRCLSILVWLKVNIKKAPFQVLYLPIKNCRNRKILVSIHEAEQQHTNTSRTRPGKAGSAKTGQWTSSPTVRGCTVCQILLLFTSVHFHTVQWTFFVLCKFLTCFEKNHQSWFSSFSKLLLLNNSLYI